MGIDTQSVLKAKEPKWNFLKFYPGLVGGHCIGVDPYYLTYRAEQMGYHSQIILSGRRINDDMGKYVAENIVKNLIRADIAVKACEGCNPWLYLQGELPGYQKYKGYRYCKRAA